MKRILVTGATGFIGNHVIEELLQRGYQVMATSLHESKAAAFPWFSKVDYISLNLDRIDAGTDYYAYFKSPDAAIHLAWEGLPNYREAFHIEKNLPAQYAFLQNLLLNGLPDITVTGTCFEYGMQQGCLSEDMEPAPANAYAIAKDELRKKIAAIT